MVKAQFRIVMDSLVFGGHGLVGLVWFGVKRADAGDFLSVPVFLEGATNM